MKNQSPAVCSVACLRNFILVGLAFLLLACNISLPGFPQAASVSSVTSTPKSAVGAGQTTMALPPLISDPKVLANSIYKASDPQARYQALLGVMRALNIGVYEPNHGHAILRGAERGPNDFYLYDFEVKAMANAMARGTFREVAHLADVFTRAGVRVNGGPITPDILRQSLQSAVASSVASTSDPYALPYLLVRELGMQHASPYDILHISTQEQFQLDALQTFLIEADVLVPQIRKLAILNQSEGLKIAALRSSNQALPILAQQGPCDDMTGIGGITPFGKYLLALKDWADVTVLILDMIHGEALAYSVDVSAVTKADSTHFGPQAHSADAGKEMRLKIKVEMLDDFGDVLVSCGKLLGWEFPKRGGIPGVGIIWDTGGLEKNGTVAYEPPDKKTDPDGIATLVFKPKDEKRPRQGPQVEERGTVMGLATYQSAFGNIPGSIAQFLAPKTAIMAWIVARHKNLTLQVSMEGSLTLDDTTAQYGPNTITIPLENETGTAYVGTKKGDFTSKVTGEDCTVSITFPTTFKVTATGTDPLNFSVQSSGEAGKNDFSCGDGGGGGSWPGGSVTRTFSLPSQDGASKTYSMDLAGAGKIDLTFTLKEE